MRQKPRREIERMRIMVGEWGSPYRARWGLFVLPDALRVIASDGQGWEESGMPMPAWEHVSVSYPDRYPPWEVMCWAKDVFWSPDEAAMQFHPREEDYVKHHPHCLHLWKPIGVDFPMPPARAVGPKGE